MSVDWMTIDAFELFDICRCDDRISFYLFDWFVPFFYVRNDKSFEIVSKSLCFSCYETHFQLRIEHKRAELISKFFYEKLHKSSLTIRLKCLDKYIELFEILVVRLTFWIENNMKSPYDKYVDAISHSAVANGNSDSIRLILCAAI